MKGLLKRSVSSDPFSIDAALFALRLGVGSMMAFSHGLKKVTGLGTFFDSVARHGLPFPGLLAPAAALSEFVGGLLLALGLFTRSAASFVLITMLVAAFWVHRADPFSKKEMALLYACCTLVLLLAGPGKWSLDAHWRRR
ncbi:MAG TPA: DoxX family protein [Polyangiaceae bacterium]|nr:DoxX family protein [Polyangiaceae bacterium]